MKKTIKYICLCIIGLLFTINGYAQYSTTIGNSTWTWTLQGKVLTISGNGTMQGVSSSWRSSVEKVIILEGVTSICGSAFSGYSSLTSVTIPNSVTTIGDGAFNGCSSLTSVTIPNSITTIGGYAFYGCSSLTSVTIPNNVTTIGGRAFYGCSSLTSIITIPNNVTTIGGEAFRGCSSLTTVNYNATNCTYDKFNEYNYNGCFDSCSNLSTLNIGNNVKTIPDYIFSSLTGLTSITIPNSVTTIGSSAFNACSSLTSVTIPNSVTTIGYGAFANSGLTSITIPNSVTAISYSTFWYCTSLASVTIGNGITAIGDRAFNNCNSLTTVNYNATNCTEIGYDIFGYCDSLAVINIGNNVETIPAEIFSGCCSLTSVTIGNNVTTIGNHAFCGSNLITTVNYNATNCTEIGHDIFGYCDSLAVINIGNNVETIPAGIFSGCSSLTSITIPNNVTTIGGYAFNACSSLTSVTIPNSVTTIGDGAFYGCSSLTSVTIPNSVTTIGSGAFSFCSSLTSVTIPNNVTTIGGEAFRGCSSLTSVTIPNNVTTIGDGAFSSCSSLTSVAIGNKITNIEDCTFQECRNLISINIPDSVTKIGTSAFSNCSSLKSIDIPNSVTEIEYRAFNGCSSLKNVDVQWAIPLVVDIKDYIFNGIDLSQDTLYVPAGTKKLYEKAPVWQDFGTIIEKGEITCSINETSLVPGESYYVKYEALGEYDNRNRFLVQLSDSIGSFDNPALISDLSTIVYETSGLIKIIIPDDMPGGNKYRLRVFSTSPEKFGSDNGVNLTIENAYKLTEYLTLYYNKKENLSDTKFVFSGNLNINNILYFDCPLEVEQRNRNTAIIKGDGTMYANDIKGNSYQINTNRTGLNNYKGLIYYTAFGEYLNMILSSDNYVIGAVQLAGVQMNIGNIEFDKTEKKDWIKMDYSVNVGNPPFPIKNIIDFCIKEESENPNLSDEQKRYSKYIPSKFKGNLNYSHSEGHRYAFDVAFSNLTFPSFKIEEFELYYNPAQNEYKGAATITILGVKNPITQLKSTPITIISEIGDTLQTMPLDEYILLRSVMAGQKDLTFGFDLSYKRGRIDFMAFMSGVEIPIYTSGLAITKFASTFGYDRAAEYFGFGATVDIAPVGNKATLGLTSAIIEGRDIGFNYGNPPFSLMLSGKLALFKQEMADGKIGWDGKKSAFNLSGNINVVDIYRAKLDANFTTDLLWGQSYGYLQAPQWLTKYDFFSSYSGRKFQGVTANWYGRSFDFELENHFFGKHTKICHAAVYIQDIGYKFYWGKNLKELGINTTLRATQSEINFFLGESNVPEIYVTAWGKDVPIDISVVSPSGKSYGKAEANQYVTSQEDQQTILLVENPEAGEWKIIPGAEYEVIKVYSSDLISTVMFDKPLTTETSTDIRLLLNDFDDGLTVTLFYDDDKTGFNGVPIVELTDVKEAILDYTWNVADLPAGNYYIYCRVDDGKNTPILLYAPGAISVNNSSAFDVIPQNVKQENSENNIVISWDASNDKRINYATVYYKNDKTGEVLGRVSDEASVVLDDLVPGMRYQVWAAYTDTLNNEGAISNIVEFTYTATGNNPPYITANDDYWVFREGQRLKMDLTAYDADGDNLFFNILENISGYQITSGSFSWQPTASDLSLEMLHIVVSDGLAKDTLQQKIRFIDKENQDITVSFAASVLYDANFHFVKVKNPLLTRSKFENVLIQNKRTGYTIVLPCDLVSDDLFMGKLVLTNDQYSFIPVQSGDTIQLSYQYAGYDYTDYAVYSPVVTKAFRLKSGDVASLNGWQYAIEQEESEQINNQSFLLYPNPNSGEFYIQIEGLKDAADYVIAIFDLQGKCVYNGRDICSDNAVNKKIDLENLTAGHYLIKLDVYDNTGKKIYSDSRKMIVR